MHKKVSGVSNTTNSAIRSVSITVNIASNVSEKAKNMSDIVRSERKNKAKHTASGALKQIQKRLMRRNMDGRTDHLIEVLRRT